MNCTLAELRAHPKSIQIQEYLSDNLGEKRFQHVLSVQALTVDLAHLHGANVWQANLAALLHDSAKWMSPQELYTEAERYEIRLDRLKSKIRRFYIPSSA